MGSAEYRHALQIWLGLVPDPLKTSGDKLTRRHHAVRDTLYDMAVAAGAHPYREAVIGEGAERPADVLLPAWPNGRPLAVDVSFTHPTQSPTTVQARGGRTASQCAVAARERAKMDRYQNLCRDEEADFLPLVGCAFGGWSSGALAFLKLLSYRMAVRAAGPAALVHAANLRAISVVIWRENARIGLGAATAPGGGAGAVGWAENVLDQTWDPWRGMLPR